MTRPSRSISNSSHVVCLTKSRIVEALFERAGSLLIPLDDENSPKCQRLRSRDVPFAMLGGEQIADIKDGDRVEVESDLMRVVSQL